MRQLFNYKIKEKNYLYYFIILLITLLVCIPLFNSKFMIVKDDGIHHIYRIMGSLDSIKENSMFPQIMSSFCNGFGYSWNIFYSPFTAYAPIIFAILSNSYIMGLKLFMFVLMLFSAIFMYLLVLKISKSKSGALISAILYLLAPYHLTDMYSRVAVAELASFTFLPIVFIGLYDIFEEPESQSYYLSIGAILLILSHNVMSMYIAIFCFIYCIINIQKLKDKEILKKLLINCVIILLVTSFYWVPLLEHRFMTDYEVFKQDRMYNDRVIRNSKLSLLQFIYMQKIDRILTIGIPMSLGLLAFFIYLIKNKFKINKTLLIFACFGIISTIMASEVFPFEYLPDIFKMLQFPWRMVEFSVFFFSIIIGVIVLDLLKKKKYKIIAIVLSIIIIGGTTYLTLGDIVKYYNFDIPDKVFFSTYQIRNSKDRIHIGHASLEYLPTKAYENLQYIVERSNEILLINGEASIGEFTKKDGIGKSQIIKTRRDWSYSRIAIYILFGI